MIKYDLYAGLGGGFGGAEFIVTGEYSSIEEAEKDAYQLAVEEYESYEGCHGIMSWKDCKEELTKSFGYEPIDEDVDDYYREEIESWITYYVIPRQ